MAFFCSEFLKDEMNAQVGYMLLLKEQNFFFPSFLVEHLKTIFDSDFCNTILPLKIDG